MFQIIRREGFRMLYWNGSNWVNDAARAVKFSTWGAAKKVASGFAWLTTIGRA